MLKHSLEKIKKTENALLFKKVLDKFWFIPLKVSWLYFVMHDNNCNKSMRIPFQGEIRWATPDDLEVLCTCLNKRKAFKQRFKIGDHCLIAFEQDTVAAYEWFSTNHFHHEQKNHYTISIPKNAIYAYDAYTCPNYRMQGIWPAFRQKLCELQEKTERNTVIAFLEYGNTKTMCTHFRYGYQLYKRVKVWKIFNMFFHRTKMLEHNQAKVRQLIALKGPV
jgi:hypothetical protein